MIFLLSTRPFVSRIILLLIRFTLLFFILRFSNWISYVLCIVYLGGIIIVLIYISSLTPNTKNKISILIPLILGRFIIKINLNIYRGIIQIENFIIVTKFYSIIFFKLWIFLLIFIIIILIFSRDLCKIFISPIRLI